MKTYPEAASFQGILAPKSCSEVPGSLSSHTMLSDGLVAADLWPDDKQHSCHNETNKTGSLVLTDAMELVTSTGSRSTSRSLRRKETGRKGGLGWVGFV